MVSHQRLSVVDPWEKTMHEAYLYQGHRIELHLNKVDSGHVQSTYFIDAKYCFQHMKESLSIDEVRADALRDAYKEVDRLIELTAKSNVASLAVQA